ncbi:MAG: exodeoxyribonuclease VII small subunit [Nitrospirota bacterium]
MNRQKKITYSQAIEELEGIIQDIETENIDVDALTEKVRRATTLIKFCKRNLRTTEEEVKKVLSEIEETPESEEAENEPF